MFSNNKAETVSPSRGVAGRFPFSPFLPLFLLATFPGRKYGEWTGWRERKVRNGAPVEEEGSTVQYGKLKIAGGSDLSGPINQTSTTHRIEMILPELRLLSMLTCVSQYRQTPAWSVFPATMPHHQPFLGLGHLMT